jgi:hypothetical protein
MGFDNTILPYYYENEDDPVQLPNGMTRHTRWDYKLVSPVSVFLVEQLTRSTTYLSGKYTIHYSRFYEWHHQKLPGSARGAVVEGYRQYETGRMTRGDADILEPEVAVILAYTPEEDTIPAFIETVEPDTLQLLLDDLANIADDTRNINAWMNPPFDAPATAPEDISATMLQMRREIGLRATRGRERVVRGAMRLAGVTIGDAGWILTPDELARRQQLHAEASAAQTSTE